MGRALLTGPEGPDAPAVEGWLAELGLGPADRVDREGTSAWDLRLDGRRRFDVPVTVILDPAVGVLVWLHMAPPIGDGLRRSYRKLLRWNDEFPFVKFSLAADDRPIATIEIPTERVDLDALGLAIARLLAICDVLLEETAEWIWIRGRVPEQGSRVGRNAGLLDRYADRLGELALGPSAEPR